MTSILDTGKDGYDADAEFDQRTKAAVEGKDSEWGDPGELLLKDAVEVIEFVQGDFRSVAPILAELRRYGILDLGCGYGRLAPLLSAFDCYQYVGVERSEERFLCAEARWDNEKWMSVVLADALEFRLVPELWYGQPFNVVWTSCVLQHFTIPDKLRLVETMKACRAPGGLVIMREGEIRDEPRGECAMLYASPTHAKHMIPIPFTELAEAFKPLKLEQLWKIGNSPHRVYVAREKG